MFHPRASLGLVLLGLLSLAGWGCSKGPSQEEDAGKTGGGEVKASDNADSPQRPPGRAVGKVRRKMQADEKADAHGGPPGMGVRRNPTKTAAPRWKTDASDTRFDRPVFKTEAKTTYEAPDKTEYKTDLKTAEKGAGGPSFVEEEVLICFAKIGRSRPSRSTGRRRTKV